MGRRKKTTFEESLALNVLTYEQYVMRLQELAISMFEWVNVPDTIDIRYIETCLFRDGSAIYFNDEEIGNLCLSFAPQGSFDVYGEPINRRAYSMYNNYQKKLDRNNSVIIWNNYLRTNSVLDMEMFARRLANLDRIVDVNSNAQKTPIILLADEKDKLTLTNVYKEYDGNAPVIHAYKGFDKNSVSVLTTEAPFVADKIYTLKTQIWNEALTYLGISNINVQKKERLITDEVTRNQGGTIASRYSRLEMRRKAVDQINKMFGTNIEVNYREDFQQVGLDNEPEDPGADTIGDGGNE